MTAFRTGASLSSHVPNDFLDDISQPRPNRQDNAGIPERRALRTQRHHGVRESDEHWYDRMFPIPKAGPHRYVFP
jgi:hypothetical protein